MDLYYSHFNYRSYVTFSSFSRGIVLDGRETLGAGAKSKERRLRLLQIPYRNEDKILF